MQCLAPYAGVAPILLAAFEHQDAALRREGERGGLLEEPSVDQRRRPTGR